MKIISSEKVKEDWKSDRVKVTAKVDGEVQVYEFGLRKQYIMMSGLPMVSVWNNDNAPEAVEDYVRKEYGAG